MGEDPTLTGAEPSAMTSAGTGVLERTGRGTRRDAVVALPTSHRSGMACQQAAEEKSHATCPDPAQSLALILAACGGGASPSPGATVKPTGTPAASATATAGASATATAGASATATAGASATATWRPARRHRCPRRICSGVPLTERPGRS